MTGVRGPGSPAVSGPGSPGVRGPGSRRVTVPAAGATPDRRRILAMGGGGFTMGDRSGVLDRLVLELTGKPLPRICFLPTASGDQREQVLRFHERFSAWPCEPSTLSLFHLARDRVDPVAHLLSQDAIYVGGGSMRNMLAVWREHGVDVAMHRAWSRGTVLAGLSAGAMCWFEAGLSMSGGTPQPVRGIGILAGSLSVHLDGEPERLPAYAAAVAAGRLPAGYAADDGAALVYAGRRLLECVASRPGAHVVHMHAENGAVHQEPMPMRLLAEGGDGDAGGDADAGPRLADRLAVAELRALRSGGRRWD